VDELQAELIAAVRGVPGWFGNDEAWALHEIVRTHPSAGADRPVVVELGSWQGRSTIVIARALRARGSGVVHAVDPHRGTALHAATGVPDTYEAFRAHVAAAGVAPYVRCIRALSADARAGFARRSVDVLFVDAAHAYRDVLRDIDAWTSALADGAAVAFHDAVDYPGVRRALEKRVLGRRTPFHNARQVEATLFVEFRSDGARRRRLRRR
jgi:MMP 1-O-methyltransferase